MGSQDLIPLGDAAFPLSACGWCCFPNLLTGGASLSSPFVVLLPPSFYWVVVLPPLAPSGWWCFLFRPVLSGAAWLPPFSFFGVVLPSSSPPLGGVLSPSISCWWCCFPPLRFWVVLLSPSHLEGVAAFPSSSFWVVVLSTLAPLGGVSWPLPLGGAAVLLFLERNEME